MATRRKYGRASRYPRYSGYDYAARHIEEAQAFSREIGGTDTDVKAYFFGLPKPALDELFVAYGAKYDEKAEAYARLTFPKWKSGATKMSGLVAKRLFDLLPSRMPPSIKLQLAENLWRHFGPNSRIDFMVGPLADATEVVLAVYQEIEKAIQDYGIPENVGNRFSWVCGGDVKAKEAMLNHFRKQEADLTLATLDAQLPILQAQMRDHGDTTDSIRTSVDIHRITVNLWIDRRLEGTYRMGQPTPKPMPMAQGGGGGAIWAIILVMIVLTLWFVASHGRH